MINSQGSKEDYYMPKLIRTWKELVGLESENYKLEIELMKYDGGCGFIVPKVETEETKENYSEHHVYLSTRIFYRNHYKIATELLQKYGFDIELVEDEIKY
jgi:hypothetical protein